MSHTLLSRTTRLLAGLLLALAGLQASAQTDVPSRIGRISQMEGATSYAPGGSNDWSPAEYNRPLTTGDRLQTAPGARNELHIGSTALRSSGPAALEIAQLDDDTARLTLERGSLALRVRQIYPGEQLEIDTPNLAFTISQPGEYRLDVDPRLRTTAVTVRSGSGVAYGESGQARGITAGQQIRFVDRQLSQEVFFDNPPRDSFDMWASARDRAEDQSLSARYVSRDTVGYQQLDAYGEWRTDTEFGTVWIPRVNSSQWAPFRNGQWRWIEPWGWTWVDDAPWGFAPFHYGRWAQIGAQWCWVPGPVMARPAYVPAVVGFRDPFADRDRHHPPNNNWYPLAPGQTWRPANPNRPPESRPGLPPGVGANPAWRDRPPSQQAIPMPRPQVHMVEPMMQAPNNLQDLQQRAQLQRQQQLDRERQQQEQNRIQLQGQQREQMQRDAVQQQMREQQNRIQQQQAEQAQREQAQRERNQRAQQQQQQPQPQPQPAQQIQPMPRPQVQEAKPNTWTPDRKRILLPGEALSR